MPISIEYEKDGELWHGWKVWERRHWYDLGIISIDYHPAFTNRPGFWLICFWKFNITFK